MIEFLLNQTPVQLDNVAPTLSVLDWLRTKSDQRGTKEGCASGDCGACTVVIGEPAEQGVRYRHINACLMLVGHLHGKHLVTVEGLSTDKSQSLDTLHPVQRAMVECHGSQCGFCTPGFVMSMFMLYMNHTECPPHSALIEALGGNLCRCTGYRPILQACEAMFAYPRAQDPFTQSAVRFFQTFEPTVATLTSGDQQYFAPQNMTQLLALREAHPQARLIAGGTDLSLAFTQDLHVPDAVIAVNAVKEMQRIETTDSELVIGAAASYDEVAPVLLTQFPEAGEMFHRLGSAQIRNAGTLGGSLGNASPIGDPAPLFIALQGSVDLTGPKGSRNIPLHEFFVAYRKTRLADDEVIVAVRLPLRRPDQKLVCYKISKRMEDDISTVLMVLSFDLDDNRMVSVSSGFGGMAAIPQAAASLEAALEGQPLSEAALQAAGQALAKDFNPMTDVRASREYRLQVCQNLLQRLWHEHQSVNVRVAHAAL